MNLLEYKCFNNSILNTGMCSGKDSVKRKNIENTSGPGHSCINSVLLFLGPLWFLLYTILSSFEEVEKKM